MLGNAERGGIGAWRTLYQPPEAKGRPMAAPQAPSTERAGVFGKDPGKMGEALGRDLRTAFPRQPPGRTDVRVGQMQDYPQPPPVSVGIEALPPLPGAGVADDYNVRPTFRYAAGGAVQDDWQNLYEAPHPTGGRPMDPPKAPPAAADGGGGLGGLGGLGKLLGGLGGGAGEAAGAAGAAEAGAGAAEAAGAAATGDWLAAALPMILALQGGGRVPLAGGGLAGAARRLKRRATPKLHEAGHGLVDSPTPGRADQVAARVRAGSYVVPADVVAGAGEGNNAAGAQAITSRLKFASGGRVGYAAGGEVGPDAVDVRLSGGEVVIPPEDVASLGRGNHEAGARKLDEFVSTVRQHVARLARELPPPR